MSQITTIFFDLDGTLLDINDSIFEEVYIPQAFKHFNDRIDYPSFQKHLLLGTEIMIKNTEYDIVVDAFFDYFAPIVNLSKEETIKRFIKFYETNFDELKHKSRKLENAKTVVDLAKSKDMKLALATQPLFYELATIKRIEWAGIDPDDFDLITHATNSRRCKPSPEYFQDLLTKIESTPEETLMVGNDYLFDMSAKLVGISTFMVDTNQTNSEYREKFKPDKEGSLDDLLKLLNEI
jgi:FMN phosphatase YigB (HAD superfamily)